VVEKAIKLEGFTRGTSVHAAGVVVSPDELTNHVPLAKSKDGQVITQYDMGILELLGMLKIDVLGLRTLSMLDHAERLVRQHYDPSFTLESIPIDDPETFRLLQEGKTMGVFQLEGTNMRKILIRLRPTTLEDIIALNALYRPGPIQSGMVDEYIERKHGKPFEYEFPELLRGAVERGYDEKKIVKLWEDIEKFASYSFNKSHSAAYGLMAYWTAYLKAHYPLAFYTAALSSFKGSQQQRFFKNAPLFIAEMRKVGIRVVPPDVNRSDVDFTLDKENNAVVWGLGFLKDVGLEMAERIVKERERGGEYRSVSDFARRTKANKKVLEALAKAGALDSISGMTRSQLLKDIRSGRVSKRATGSLFGSMMNSKVEEAREDLNTLLNMERQSLGLYISGKPYDAYRDVAKAYGFPKIEELENHINREVVFVASLLYYDKRKFRSGTKLSLLFEDDTGTVDATMFISEGLPDLLEKLENNLVFVVKGTVRGVSDDNEEEERIEVRIKDASSIVPIRDFIAQNRILRNGDPRKVLEAALKKFEIMAPNGFKSREEGKLAFVRFWIRELFGEEFAEEVPYSIGLRILKRLIVKDSDLFLERKDAYDEAAYALLIRDADRWFRVLKGMKSSRL